MSSPLDRLALPEFSRWARNTESSPGVTVTLAMESESIAIPYALIKRMAYAVNETDATISLHLDDAVYMIKTEKGKGADLFEALAAFMVQRLELGPKKTYELVSSPR